jgi:hypothetical protein
MQLDLTVLTKTKENDLLLRIVRIQWQTALNTVTNDLARVSVPAEGGSQQSAIITHALKGSSTWVPTHFPSGSALSYTL